MRNEPKQVTFYLVTWLVQLIIALLIGMILGIAMMQGQPKKEQSLVKIVRTA